MQSEHSGLTGLSHLLLLAGAIAPASDAHPAPTQYSKQNYIFASLDIPSTAARSQPETFVVRRGGARTTIVIDASTPHYDQRETDCRGGQLTYKLDRPNVFAYSCKVGAEIIYVITKYGRTYRVGASDATEQIGYTIRYPASQVQYWAPVVTHMTRSLRFSRVGP